MERANQIERAATLFTAAGYSAKAATVIRPLRRASSSDGFAISDDLGLISLADQVYVAIISRDIERCRMLSLALLELAARIPEIWHSRFATLLSALIDSFAASSSSLSVNGEQHKLQSLSKLLETSALRGNNDALYLTARRLTVVVGLFKKQLFTKVLQQKHLELSEKLRRLFISNRENATPELWPSQQAAIHAGALTQPSFVISLPTSSGKTLLAQLRIARFLESNPTGTVVYVSPYIALATQVTRELESRFDSLGVLVTRLTGAYELDLAPPGLGRIIVTTPEKLDALVRRSGQSASALRVIKNLGLLVLDECHHLGSGARGITFELLITRLKRRHPNLDIFAMSAATSNAADVASWVAGRPDAHILDAWSPTRRKVYVYQKNGAVVLSGATEPSATIETWRKTQDGVRTLV